ncbi:Rrf2 family transcriptional regulator [Pontibacter sp. SGAir0037]|uniref:RrF2 family transcriptional regulator n=1 Tax=Pontibacter sp. SGAir0037 TaxID=2571030 RepID=UPI0010CD2C55|nr:Rrf2 family transcriptional regulator [Pontibacter sp. SGAir0037]QCR24739.1 transcriptional regulator [Pontibacter sp. SGAir0037]
MLSKKAKYALKALIVLAQKTDNTAATNEEIAQLAGIPKKFCEAILLDLKKNGMLHSRRGRSGGYVLREHPSKLTVADVIRIMDGPLALTTCTRRVGYVPCEECHNPETCEVRMIMKRVRDATVEILEGISIQDAVDQPKVWFPLI